MTNSRSITSTSRWLVAIAALVLLASSAYAGGRKRIVVLDFEGPKADKFHDDLVRLVKKSHTVISTEKWNGAAEELDAAKVTEKNIKKVAKKLKIDGVVTGKIEKRRDEYILRIKLRAGTSGEIVGNTIDTKADGPRIEGKAQKDLKDELISAIDDLEGNHGGGGDDDDGDKPAKKKKGGDDDDDGDKPAKKKKGDDDDDGDKPKKGGFAKHDDDSRGGDKVGDPKKKPAADDDEDVKPKKGAKKDDDADVKPKKGAKKDDDEDAFSKPRKGAKKDDDASAALSTKHDDDESPVSKKKKKTDDADGETPKKKRKVAKSDEDEDGGDVEAEADGGGEPVESELALSPGHRAIDAMVGLSFTARKLSFNSASDLAQKPPNYNQGVPVAGAMFDLTVYPLAFNHDKTGPQTGIGFHVMYDRVIKINSQKKYTDSAMMTQTANLQTAEDRFTLGAVYRYPLGPGATAPVVGGGLAYSHQQFGVQQSLPNGMATDIPNVSYTIIEPSGFFKYVVAPKITLNVDAGFMVITGAGAITNDATPTAPVGYGGATVTGFEGAVGGDYAIAKNLFARAAFRIEKIGLTFKGDMNSMANNRDSDPAQDVFGASDLYYGFITTIGYLY